MQTLHHPKPADSKRPLWDFLFCVLIKVILPLILTAAVIMLTPGCSTTRKIKTSETLKIDATSLLKADSGHLVETDSTGQKTEERATVSKRDSVSDKIASTTETETITVHLTPLNGSATAIDTSRPANDYTRAPQVFDVNINGHTIHSNRPIDNIVIASSRGSQVIDHSRLVQLDSAGAKINTASTVSRLDSGHKSTSDSSHLSLEDKKTSKDVKRSGIRWYWWILLVVAGAAQLYFWPYPWAFFRRRKDKSTPISRTMYAGPKSNANSPSATDDRVNTGSSPNDGTKLEA